MGLVLWIDKNTFASSFLEKVFKTKNLPFYTLSSTSDFSYLVADLRPALLVLDAETAWEGREALFQQYQTSEELRRLPVVLIDDRQDLDFLNKVGEIKRPFDPYKIPERLKNFIL
jgi:hypothetical protein